MSQSKYYRVRFIRLPDGSLMPINPQPLDWGSELGMNFDYSAADPNSDPFAEARILAEMASGRHSRKAPSFEANSELLELVAKVVQLYVESKIAQGHVGPIDLLNEVDSPFHPKAIEAFVEEMLRQGPIFDSDNDEDDNPASRFVV